jgi:uncharacterized protein (TIGR03435 family)
MRHNYKRITVCLASSVLAFAQTKSAFEVATIKPARPIDQARIIAAVQSGGKIPLGTHIEAGRAEYLYADLRSLIATAYGVKPNQVTGPDWMATTRFDILAKMPTGAPKSDASQMLQSLLEDRFRLVVHRSSIEHPVLAIVPGKGALKLKASAQAPVPIDENAPLSPGERQVDSSDGPIRMTFDASAGTAVINMGTRGRMIQRVDQAKQTVHLDFSMTTMSGLADMLTQVVTQLGGGAGRQIVDMTDIKGNYDVSLEIPLAALINMMRSAGMDIPVDSGRGPVAGPADSASDPGGMSSSMTDAVQALGLKLESRKAMVEQVIVDKIEKTPTEN